MEDLIEELTKVNPSNLSEEGLKLFNTINEIIDRNKKLEEENLTLRRVDKIVDNITVEKIEKAIQEAEKEYISIGLIKEDVEELKADRKSIEKDLEEAKKENNKKYCADLLRLLNVNYGAMQILQKLLERSKKNGQ